MEQNTEFREKMEYGSPRNSNFGLASASGGRFKSKTKQILNIDLSCGLGWRRS